MAISTMFVHIKRTLAAFKPVPAKRYIMLSLTMRFGNYGRRGGGRPGMGGPGGGQGGRGMGGPPGGMGGPPQGGRR